MPLLGINLDREVYHPFSSCQASPENFSSIFRTPQCVFLLPSFRRTEQAAHYTALLSIVNYFFTLFFTSACLRD